MVNLSQISKRFSLPLHEATDFNIIYLVFKKLEMTFIYKRKEMAIYRQDNLETLFRKYRILDSIPDLPNKNIHAEVSGINNPGDSYHSANLGNISLLNL